VELSKGTPSELYHLQCVERVLERVPICLKEMPEYDEKAADIWSAGCVVVEMATGKPPWHEVMGAGIMPLLLKIAESESPPAVQEDFPEVGKAMLLRCFARDPVARASAAELRQHPFLGECTGMV
jgi:serine/threonine protein kinase